MISKYLPFNFEQPTPLDRLVMATKRAVLLALLFGLVSNLMMLALPIYSMQVLDRVISSQSVETLLMLTFIVLACLVGLVLVQLARTIAFSYLAEWLERQISPILFDMAVRQSARNKSVIGSQAVADFQFIKNFAAGGGVTNILDAPWSLLFVFILFLIHPMNGLVTILGAATLLLCAVKMDKATKTLLEKANEKMQRSRYSVDLAARNAEVILAMGMGLSTCNRWMKDTESCRELQLKATQTTQRYQSISKFLRFIIQVMVTGLGGYLVIHGSLTSGQMIAGSILVSRALAPFEALIASWKNVVMARKSYLRLQEMLSKHTSLKVNEIALPAPVGNLAVKDVSFTPPNTSRATLHNISFELNPGEVLAIIGESAAGKSTLARILTGVWKPASGSVRLDSADIYSWVHASSEANGGKHIGYLPQDIELFNASIKENIARMELEPDDKAVIEAAKTAGIHDMILNFPAGYDTRIGYDGMALSGGQRQRVGLARAFYGNPKFLVLDEPNANLDRIGEQALSEAITSAKVAGITTIVISHRPTILDVVDKVLVLSQGAIAAFGTRDDIIKNFIKSTQLGRAGLLAGDLPKASKKSSDNNSSQAS